MIDNVSYQSTPFGLWPSDCVYLVDSGAVIEHSTDHLLIDGTRHSHCNSDVFYSVVNTTLHKADGNGWQAYVKSDMGTAVSGYSAKWAVPPLPQKKDSKEELYTFIALQNMDWVPPHDKPTEQWDILQPTLSYGYGTATDGTYFVCVNLISSHFLRI